MSPKPSLLLIEIRNAIKASGLKDLGVSHLTSGKVSDEAIRHYRTDDGVLPNPGTVESLARGFSRSPAVVSSWIARLHPIGEDCVAYWASLYEQAKRESRRRVARATPDPPIPPSTDDLPKVPETIWEAISARDYHPLSEYCEL
jgi:hypothetical protein